MSGWGSSFLFQICCVFLSWKVLDFVKLFFCVFFPAAIEMVVIFVFYSIAMKWNSNQMEIVLEKKQLTIGMLTLIILWETQDTQPEELSEAKHPHKWGNCEKKWWRHLRGDDTCKKIPITSAKYKMLEADPNLERGMRIWQAQTKKALLVSYIMRHSNYC